MSTVFLQQLALNQVTGALIDATSDRELLGGLNLRQVAATQAMLAGGWILGQSPIAVMGDSIAAQNSNIVGGTYSTMARGPVSWMLSYLGHPWDFQPSDNFAVSETNLDAIIAAQLAPLLAAHATRRYTRCFISAGTNDTNGARTVAQIKIDFTTLFNALSSAGIRPVMTGIRPRGSDGAVTAAKRQNAQLNEWLYLLSLTGAIDYIPAGAEVYADNSTAFGNCLAALMYDSVLHPNTRGAALEGRAMANYFIAKGVVPGIAFATQQSDSFERTDNPAGVAFNAANPLLQGGTTTPTGMTVTGGTWSLGSRTLSNGQTRPVRSCALAASTLHHLYDDWTKTGAWLATDLQPGDIIEARASIVLTSAVAVNSVTIRLAEHDGNTSLSHYGLFSNESAVLSGNHTLYLRSPRITVRSYFGSGNVNIFARVECQTDGGASGTFDVHAFEVRKVA